MKLLKKKAIYLNSLQKGILAIATIGTMFLFIYEISKDTNNVGWIIFSFLLMIGMGSIIISIKDSDEES